MQQARRTPSPSQRNTRTGDGVAARVRKLNQIIYTLGVSSPRASDQIFSKPHNAHVISMDDLRVLSQLAGLLITHEDVVCDFSALSQVLWGMLRDIEPRIDEVYQKYVLSSSSASSTGDASATASAAQVVYQVLHPCLVLIVRLTGVLRAFEEPSARPVVRDSVRVAQQDASTCIRTTQKLNAIFDRMGAAPQGNPLSVTGTYSRRGHVLFRMTELAVVSLEVLVSALACRSEVDLAPVVTFMNSEELWRTSGLGHLSAESYCDSMQRLIYALMNRRRDFANAEEATAKLILNRLATRPPFRGNVFELLHFRASEKQHMGVKGNLCFGMLLMLRTVQHSLERCLVTHDSMDVADKNLSRILRRSVERGVVQVEQQTEGRRLSFYQLLVVAAVQGMPEADLTDDKALLERATATNLTTESEVLVPSLLRLLLACAYTVPTGGSSTVEHSFLSPASTLALYDALAEHIFQEPAFRVVRAGGEEAPINQLFVSSGLGTDSLVKLVLLNALHHSPPDGEEAAVEAAAVASSSSTASAQASLAATAAATDAASGTSATKPAPAAPPAKKATAAVALHTAIAKTVRAVFNANDARFPAAKDEQRNRDPTGDAFRAITLTAVKHLFTCIASDELVSLNDSTDVLYTMARIFALRAVYPISPQANEKEKLVAKRLMTAMERRLAFIPQKMCSQAVNAVLMNSIVPYSTTLAIAQFNRPRLALLEAFFRSLATSSAAFAVSTDLMATHWVDAVLPAVKNRYSAALATAAHDFLVAPFLAHKSLSPLFVPTYVALFVPTTRNSKYGEPHLTLVERFASMTRSACQGLELCDATELQKLIGDPQSAVAKLAAASGPSLSALTPISAVLLVVSALFDKLCLLWNSSPGFSRDAQQRFTAYFSALVNLLQCTDTEVLHRVCASVEAIIVEHLRGAKQVQLQFLKYVEATVDRVRGNSKKGVAEWYLRLSEKVLKENDPKAKL